MKLVILTCNRIDHLKKTLSDWHVVDKSNIIVIDNGSKDGSFEYILENGYECIRFDENVGISSAQVECLNYVNSDWILFVDDDISPLQDDLFFQIEKFCNIVGENYSVAPSINIQEGYYPRVLGEEVFDDGVFEKTTHVGGIRALHINACNKILHIERDLERYALWRKLGGKVGYAKWLKAIHRGENDSISDRGFIYKF